VPAYTVKEDAVRHAKRLIDARQYVLRSRWQDVQPSAREQNAFLKMHSWEEFAARYTSRHERAPDCRALGSRPCLGDGLPRGRPPRFDTGARARPT